MKAYGAVSKPDTIRLYNMIIVVKHQILITT